jgi:hypothetical protein
MGSDNSSQRLSYYWHIKHLIQSMANFDRHVVITDSQQVVDQIGMKIGDSMYAAKIPEINIQSG